MEVGGGGGHLTSEKQVLHSRLHKAVDTTTSHNTHVHTCCLCPFLVRRVNEDNPTPSASATMKQLRTSSIVDRFKNLKHIYVCNYSKPLNDIH